MAKVSIGLLDREFAARDFRTRRLLEDVFGRAIYQQVVSGVGERFIIFGDGGVHLCRSELEVLLRLTEIVGAGISADSSEIELQISSDDSVRAHVAAHLKRVHGARINLCDKAG